MPLINPFNPEPKIIEQPMTQIEYNEILNRVMNYLNCINWKCPNCGCVVFGRTLVCPFNSNGQYCKTKKPE